MMHTAPPQLIHVAAPRRAGIYSGLWMTPLQLYLRQGFGLPRSRTTHTPTPTPTPPPRRTPRSLSSRRVLGRRHTRGTRLIPTNRRTHATPPTAATTPPALPLGVSTLMRSQPSPGYSPITWVACLRRPGGGTRSRSRHTTPTHTTPAGPTHTLTLMRTPRRDADLPARRTAATGDTLLAATTPEGTDPVCPLTHEMV
eukprot:Rmarinus@m.11182